MNRSLSIPMVFLLFTTPLMGQYALEQTLGAPYVESIYGSEDGKAVAWVVNEKGLRNIWYSEVEEVSPRQLTSYSQDDGQGISQIRILSEYLLFVRGSGNNRFGEISNPASLPKTPLRQILRINLANKELDTVDVASSPTVRPDGKGLLYSKAGKAYFIEDITATEIKPELLFEVRRGAGGFQWSPDGGEIAFVSNRGNHSFVGAYSIQNKEIRWMDPNLTFDNTPVWSPAGDQIAFIRSPGSGKDELFNLTGGYPFEIVVSNVNTGEGNSIWQSPSDDGGFAQYYSNAPLRWTGNRILFHSEHEGWNHIYSIAPDGSGIKDLTPGLCEVENSAVSRDGNDLLVSTNCDDINRRHIWRIDIASGRSEMISAGNGIQTHPLDLDGAVAYREATHNQPTSITIQKGSSQQNLVTLPSTFPQKDLVVPEAVTFKSADGLTIHGQLFVPAKRSSRDKAPAVIFMHGGPIRQMLLGYHYSGYYANAYVLNQYLASQGYVVLAVNFRDGIGYGRDFRRAENQGPRGASEYKDIVAAGKFLQSRPEVDPEKLGLWGGSYGGLLTAMGLAKNSDMFKAGVDLHGVHDWAWRGRDFSPGGGWAITEELMDLAYHNSPISELQFWSSPVLLIHGDDDRNVMFGQTIDLQKKLDALGVHNEVLVFPDEVHGFLRYDSWYRSYVATVDFFDRFLK